MMAGVAKEGKKLEPEPIPVVTKKITEGVTFRKDVNRSTAKSVKKRSMVLDEDSFEKTFLLCSVCHESFANPLRTPKLLPCHHSFCLPCIKQLFKTEVDCRLSLAPSVRCIPSAVSIHCPTCRGNFVTTEENVKTLPTDHRIIQLLDFVKTTDRYTVSFCSKHKHHALNFFCEPCIQPVCHDCTILDHKEQDGHLVMDLNDALDKYTPLIDTAITEMESESTVLEKKQEGLDVAIKKLEQGRAELLKSIRDSFARLKEQLEEREREMESIAENEVNKEKKKLDEKAEQLASRLKAVQSNMTTIKQAKAECNIEEMFSIHQNIREYKAQPPLKIKEVDEGVMTTYAFNAGDEPILMSRVGNFGDITSKVESTFSSEPPPARAKFAYMPTRSTYR